MEKKERNHSMDVARLVCAFIIVMCHVDFFLDMNEFAYYFVTRFLPRFTVPFFFSVSGYYYIKALLAGKPVFEKQMKSLIKMYATWTVVYYAASFVMVVVIGKESLVQFLIDRVVNFFTIGSYSHFWYFPALIYSTVLITAAHKLGGKKGIQILAVISPVFYVIGVLGTAYAAVGLQIPYLSQLYRMDSFEAIRGILLMGLPYFCIGYFMNIWENKILAAANRKLLLGLGGMAVAYLAEIYLLIRVRWVEKPEVFFSVYLLTCAVVAVLIKNPMPKLAGISASCRRLSGFVYYVHPLLIIFLVTAAEEILGMSIHALLLYLTVIGLSLAGGFICLRWNNVVTRNII